MAKKVFVYQCQVFLSGARVKSVFKKLKRGDMPEESFLFVIDNKKTDIRYNSKTGLIEYTGHMKRSRKPETICLSPAVPVLIRKIEITKFAPGEVKDAFSKSKKTRRTAEDKAAKRHKKMKHKHRF